MEEVGDERLTALLPSEVLDVFKNQFSFSAFTPVQRRAAVHLIERKDVIVQAPTGSGKTLAYVLPAFVILRRAKKDWGENEIGCVIIVPTRELANQVGAVCRPFCEVFKMKVAVITGGKKLDEDAEKLRKTCGTIMVGTPGRLEKFIGVGTVRNAFKTVELLVVDEADRIVSMGFSRSVSEILSALPKQRRTGLFSATQVKEMEEIVKFGLRNPIRITISDCSGSADSDRDSRSVLPSSLQNYFAMVDASEKLSALVEFVRNEVNSKMIVFFSTCSTVEYMKKILTPILRKRTIFAIHRKKKNNEAHLNEFRASKKTILFCTDVMSRGIDVADVDWVVQFDVPKESSWFVHRSGRCGRSGREGKGLLLLSSEQEAYIPFLEKYEKVSLSAIKIPTSNAAKAEILRQKILKMAIADRDVLESGTRAFVSFIESYSRHDCNIVCPLKELDVVGCAHAYGLLRLPKMAELSTRDLSAFKRSDINTADIKFRDKSREKQRQAKLSKRVEERKLAEIERERQEAEEAKAAIPAVAKKRKRREVSEKRKEFEELLDDVALLKKFKKGRLSKKELDDNFTC